MCLTLFDMYIRQALKQLRSRFLEKEIPFWREKTVPTLMQEIRDEIAKLEATPHTNLDDSVKMGIEIALTSLIMLERLIILKRDVKDMKEHSFP